MWARFRLEHQDSSMYIYIYIYLLCFVCKPLNRSTYIYIYIWTIYIQSKPVHLHFFFYIYIDAIHVFTTFIMHYKICIYHFGMLQGVVLYQNNSWLQMKRKTLFKQNKMKNLVSIFRYDREYFQCGYNLFGVLAANIYCNCFESFGLCSFNHIFFFFEKSIIIKSLNIYF